MLVVGFAGGEIPQIPANLLLLKNASAVGLYWGRYMAENPKLLQYVLVISYINKVHLVKLFMFIIKWMNLNFNTIII